MTHVVHQLRHVRCLDDCNHQMIGGPWRVQAATRLFSMLRHAQRQMALSHASCLTPGLHGVAIRTTFRRNAADSPHCVASTTNRRHLMLWTLLRQSSMTSKPHACITHCEALHAWHSCAHAEASGSWTGWPDTCTPSQDHSQRTKAPTATCTTRAAKYGPIRTAPRLR